MYFTCGHKLLDYLCWRITCVIVLYDNLSSVYRVQGLLGMQAKYCYAMPAPSGSIHARNISSKMMQMSGRKEGATYTDARAPDLLATLALTISSPSRRGPQESKQRET